MKFAFVAQMSVMDSCATDDSVTVITLIQMTASNDQVSIKMTKNHTYLLLILQCMASMFRHSGSEMYGMQRHRWNLRKW